MKEYFSIGKIPFEGKDSTNPFAFKYYNPEEIIDGKTMREQLKFALEVYSGWKIGSDIGFASVQP